MFKCCVCNKSPRKGKSEVDEPSKTGQDNKKALSPVLTNSSAKIDDLRISEPEEKLNGGLQKSVRPEKKSAIQSGQERNEAENRDDDVCGLRRPPGTESAEEKKKEAEADAEAGVNEAEHGTENGGKRDDDDEEAKVKDEIADNDGAGGKKAEAEDELVEEAEKMDADGDDAVDGKREDNIEEETRGIEREGSCDDQERKGETREKESKEDGELRSEKSEADAVRNADGADELLKDDQRNILNAGSAIVKTNLYDASAYIERTIDDGPDDEGDDSVFESCPNENENSKRAPPVSAIPRWLSEEEDDGEHGSEGCSGMQEPPATPVARDELALRRHRFFSDLLQAAQNSQEHRVRFDPLGPMVHAGCESSDREEHLEELVSRLENVTKRLEKVPAQTQETAVQTNTPSPKRPTPRTDQEKRTTTPAKMSQPKSVSVCNYESFLAGPVQEYLQLSEKIGGDVAAHSKLVEEVFKSQLEYIQAAERIAAPAKNSTDMSLLTPMSKKMEEIQTFREQRRGSPYFNHLSAISESIPALGWVAVSDTPAPYVKEMNDAGQFYTNRVLKEWKEKDKIHADWCKAWVQTLSDLEKYIRQYHTTGLVWGKGLGGAPASVPPPPAGMPPPPPPSMPTADVAAMNLNADRTALFAQINQGEDIMKNLKKTGSERQTGGVPDSKNKSAMCTRLDQMKTVPLATAPISKPPVFQAVGKKWLVEYQKDANLTISDLEMNNSVYIFRCQNSTIVVQGKVNTIVMDSCYRTNLIFDAVVSSVEFVNCISVEMQVIRQVPTISIDKTDGVEMMLTGGAAEVEVISSKSSGMNILVLKENGEYGQYTVPEQYKTTVNQKGGLTTVPFDTFG